MEGEGHLWEVTLTTLQLFNGSPLKADSIALPTTTVEAESTSLAGKAKNALKMVTLVPCECHLTLPCRACVDKRIVNAQGSTEIGPAPSWLMLKSTSRHSRRQKDSTRSEPLGEEEGALTLVESRMADDTLSQLLLWR